MFKLMDFIPYDYICRAIYIIGNKLRIGLWSHADFKLFHTQAICALCLHASNKGYDMFAPFNMKNEIFFTAASYVKTVQPHWGLFQRAVCSKLFKYITYEHFYWGNKDNVDAY